MGFKGNLVSANSAATSYTSASGVWKTNEHIQANFAGNWPRSPFASFAINYLIVAGGGGGGTPAGSYNAGGAGGGAGGMLYGTLNILPGVANSIVVGGGGGGG